MLEFHIKTANVKSNFTPKKQRRLSPALLPCWDLNGQIGAMSSGFTGAGKNRSWLLYSMSR